MSHITTTVITCESDNYIETTKYDNVVNCISELNVNIPAFRVLKARDNSPKTTKLFRSKRTCDMYSEQSVLSWNIVEIITLHPVYREKVKHYFYIENSEHVTFTISTSKVNK